MASGKVEEALIRLLADQGIGAVTEVRAFRGMLNDTLGEDARRHREQVDALVSAVDIGIGREILEVPYASPLKRAGMGKVLRESAGLTEELAGWAVTCLADTLVSAQAGLPLTPPHPRRSPVPELANLTQPEPPRGNSQPTGATATGRQRMRIRTRKLMFGLATLGIFSSIMFDFFEAGTFYFDPFALAQLFLALGLFLL
ncbi:MAG: hypothetical protein ACT4OM_08615 [Actinomycetota bacterium]